jgi:hypothetical protein
MKKITDIRDYVDIHMFREGERPLWEVSASIGFAKWRMLDLLSRKACRHQQSVGKLVAGSDWGAIWFSQRDRGSCMHKEKRAGVAGVDKGREERG